MINDPLTDGALAARDLDDALPGAGFDFPSLIGDWPVAGQGHVRLGGIPAAEAHRFAAWLRAVTMSKRRSRMTISSYLVRPDGSRTPKTAERSIANNEISLMDSAWPPCECPRCAEEARR
jgi:hypothetical protein